MKESVLLEKEGSLLKTRHTSAEAEQSWVNKKALAIVSLEKIAISSHTDVNCTWKTPHQVPQKMNPLLNIGIVSEHWGTQDCVSRVGYFQVGYFPGLKRDARN